MLRESVPSANNVEIVRLQNKVGSSAAQLPPSVVTRNAGLIYTFLRTVVMATIFLKKTRYGPQGRMKIADTLWAK